MGKIDQGKTAQKPVCRNHPDKEATYRCDNCGKPYCKQCIKEQGYDRAFCSECELLVADFLGLI